jgi:hypothetical protein
VRAWGAVQPRPNRQTMDLVEKLSYPGGRTPFDIDGHHGNSILE